MIEIAKQTRGADMQLWRTIVGLIPCLLTAACGNQELTRSNAEAAIFKHNEILQYTTVIPLHRNALMDGNRQGIWIIESDKLNLTDKARAIIDRIDFKAKRMEIRTPATIRVVVTGIADVPAANNLKEAQFTLQYLQMPGITNRYAARGGTGVAIFRLFDDGWRLQNISIVFSDEPFALTESEVASAALDEQQQNEKLRQEAEDRNVARKKLQSRIAESKIPSRVVHTLFFQMDDYDFRKVQQIITITDVGVTTTCGGYPFRCATERTIWFGNIKTLVRGHHNDQHLLVNIDVHCAWPCIGSESYDPQIYGPPAEKDRVLAAVMEAYKAWKTRFSDVPVDAIISEIKAGCVPLGRHCPVRRKF